MRALRLHGARDLRLDEVPEPELRPGTVKLKVEWAGICGTDLHLFLDAPIPDDFVSPLLGDKAPHILGHEFSARVTEVADGVDDIEVGDLAAVEPIVYDGTCPACLRGDTNLCEANAFIGVHGGGGGMSEYVVVPADRVHVVPDGISAEVAALVEPLTVSWRAVSLSGIRPGDSVLITGAGPIGLGLLLAAKAQGAGQVIVSELSNARKAGADSFGADVVLDPSQDDVTARVRELTGGQGVDVGFEASGAAPAAKTLLRSVRKGATVVTVASSHAFDFGPNVLMTNEINYTGSFGYTDAQFVEVIEAIQSGRLAPEGLISDRITLDRVVEDGFKVLLDSPDQHRKVLIRP